MPTVHDRVSAAREELRAAGIGRDEADLSARVLAQHLLGWDATRYFSSANDPEPSRFGERFGALVARRAAREPTAYIVGRQEFWNLSFDVSPAVLIPRPETELIVEAVIDLLGNQRTDALRLLDVGTGSGNLAVALARELPNASIVATDISEAALRVAGQNAARHGVANRIRFVQTNLIDGVDESFDAVVANPPYVREPDRDGLQPEVREEPAEALFAGANGLALITGLVGQSVGRLKSRGFLIFEFGFGQDADIEALISEARGLTLRGFRRDLQGIARTAVVQKE